MKFLSPYLKTTVLDKLEAHCVDKRAYLCRLRRLDGDWIRFPALSKARRALSAVACESIRSYTRATDGTRGGYYTGVW